MRDAAPLPAIDAQEFASPDGPVSAVAATVPDDSEDGTRELVLGHGGEDMRQMMLDFVRGQSRGFGKNGRVITGMAVAGDMAGLGAVQACEPLLGTIKQCPCFRAVEIADVRSQHYPSANSQCQTVLEVASQG